MFNVKLFLNILKVDVPGVHLGNTVTTLMVLSRVSAFLVTWRMEQIVEVIFLIVSNVNVNVEIEFNIVKLYSTHF